MSLRIVGVHGVGNHRSTLSDDDAALALSRDWTAALDLVPTDARLDLKVAYYAPLLNPRIPQGDDDGLGWLTQQEHDWLVNWAEGLGALPRDPSQAAWSIPARFLADRIAANFGLNKLIVRPFVGLFLREVGAYLGQPSLNARNMVKAKIADTIHRHQPQIVIAHSLGSVAAYEAFWSRPDLHVDLFITIGSPLGMAGVIFDRLHPTPKEHRNRPPNIRQWVNIADRGDIIAIPRPFTSRFATDQNFDDCDIHWADFHSSRRYLAAKNTADAISTYIGQCDSSSDNQS